MKIIDLLNKVVKGEEVPKHIRVMNNDYYFNKNDGVYYLEYTSCELINNINYFSELNDEVEIIEEVEDKEYEDIEEMSMCTSGIMGFDGVEHITSHLKDKINALIRNQKYILEKLKEKK